MRKIESLMNKAISNQTNWSNANTQVTTEGDISRVFLHGNCLMVGINQTLLSLA